MRKLIERPVQASVKRDLNVALWGSLAAAVAEKGALMNTLLVLLVAAGSLMITLPLRASTTTKAHIE
ncbi:hypothetical protein [Sphingomonas oligophenolica]|uniref:hypothetical protein n=1 Tax=Sphingomonas oligophenolica TaxID=301154 RepID=UPI001127F1C5|nr:hypothetical protein [Sphingomonas oligophenolica]